MAISKANEEIQLTNRKNEELAQSAQEIKAAYKDLVRTNRLLSESEAKYQSLSDLTFEGIVVHENGVIKDCNLSFLEMTGYTRDEIIGKNIIGLVVLEKYRKMVFENIRKNYSLPYEVEAKKKDGTVFYVEIEAKNIRARNNSTTWVAAVRDISLRKENEKKLQKLSFAVNQSANVIVITDTEGNIEYVNPKFTESTGYTEKEVLGQNPRILNAGTQPKTYYADMWRDIKTGKDWKGEFHNRKKNGTLFWERVTITPLKDKEGNIINFLAVKEDITLAKEQLKIIEKERMFNEKLIRSIPGTFYVYEFGEHGAKLVKWNKNFFPLLGYTDDDLMDMYAIDFFPEDQIPFFEEKLEDLKAGKEVESELIIKHKTGKRIPYFLKAEGFEDSGKKLFLGIGIDISELKKAQEKIKASEKKLKEAQRHAHLGYWELDLINDKLYWSDEIYRIFDMQPQEFAATYEAFIENVHPDDREKVNQAYTNSLKNRIAYEVEHRLLLKNGDVKYVVEKGYSEYNEQGTPVRSLGTVQDITDRKQFEIALEEQNKEYARLNEELKIAKEKAEESNRLKTAFLNSMSHEIRTPLNAIVGFSTIIADESMKTSWKKFSKIIVEQNDLLLQLVDDILDFSQFEAGVMEMRREPVGLNHIVEDVFELFSPKCPPSILLLPQKVVSPFVILSDEVRLKQVFKNLMSNALKFTPKGSVTFGFKVNQETEVIGFVKDTGIGIPPDQQERIFERFVKLDTFSQGTGLGLPIVKSIIEAMGGMLWLESEPGKGTAVYFKIPADTALTEVEKVQHQSFTGEFEKRLRGTTILIAEDDESNFLYLKELFRGYDVRIFRAENGVQAIEWCKKEREISLVLMDIRMPFLNGFEAIKRIKEIFPRLPVIVQTAYVTPEEKAKAEASGCDAYLPKPVSRKTLFDILEKYF